ncbi:insulinase family protein [Novosphingobium sp. 1949]|uniref:Insulinase family protein n=1 Tax=Novosphingobium organovorum TaxID=2930092 RepID=A0ABT0B9S2_9SPHN|nr:M16 family metallopeptidase [Novosphingobium organovorum]MCJ2181608.1 insulinase family protein [Novosphingobium organovorum]
MRYPILLACLPFLLCVSPIDTALANGAAPDAPRVTSPPTPTWAFEKSDIALDPQFHFGTLPNGLRYIVRHNAYPAGTALVRMVVHTGSLDEKPRERGLAHFLEHMAFNGSQRVPEGQMVPLLEREGLAFGADTNASTGFEDTTYKLDLPRSDPALLDTALMLMRETASNLTLAPAAIDRERGVILSEMRDRNTFSFRNTREAYRFLYPRARFAERFAIGKASTVKSASAKALRRLYERTYVPANVTLIIVGDVDTQAVEAAIARHFADWQGPAPIPQPDAGPIAPHDAGRTDLYIDPLLSERLTVVRSGPWLDEPDSIAQRQENLLRLIGYNIVNRRLQKLSRLPSPPFRGAGFGTGDVFKAARTTRLVIDSTDGGWRQGLDAALAQVRRALAQGFTQGEVDEQLAAIRASLTVAANSAETRSNAALTAAALQLLSDDLVPSTPASALDRFTRFAPDVTPERVLAAMRREALALDNPLIRFEGRQAPAGGAAALREAWNQAMAAPIVHDPAQASAPFAYTGFGVPGTVVSERREPQLGIREIRFANGVMLNLHRSALEKDKVRVRVAIDGGDRLDTLDNPTATEMAAYLPQGGLGKNSRDDLDTIFAGHTLDFDFASQTTRFVSKATTTAQDLPTQLDLIAALVTDPGYRREGEVQYHQAISQYFAQRDGTPGSALQAGLGAILSDQDPRFSLQPLATYDALSYAGLKQAIGDRLDHGAIEIALVGDIDEDAAIAEVARTFGALPPRESAFHDNNDQPPRRFTSDRQPRVLHHTGPRDQALLRLTWPTRDDADPIDTLRLELLERVTRIALTDELREALGKTYSPGATSALSHAWKGYGTFAITASVDIRELAATRTAMRRVIAALRAAPVSADTLLRARQPMLEAFDNALKTNGGWMSLVDNAQSEPERITRFLKGRERLEALSAADVQAMAQRYLDPDTALEIRVLPEGVNN